MPQKLHPIHSLGNVSADRGDVRVERLELRKKPKVPFPHKHDFFQLIITTSGGGKHKIDFDRYTAAPARILVIKPGQVHEWELKSQTKGYLVEFTPESLGTLNGEQAQVFNDRILNLNDELKLSPMAFRNLLRALEILNEESLRPGTDSSIYRQSLLLEVLILLFRSGSSRPAISKNSSDVASDFRKLAELHFRENRSLAVYAQTLKVSLKTLAERCRETLGTSPKAVILNRKVLEAKRLLAFTAMPVSEVGYGLGFEDPNYFSRFFKEETGFSPQVFRDRSKKS